MPDSSFLPTATVRVVDVYPYRRGERCAPEFLLVRRASGLVYAGQWRMIGGKVDAGETAWHAALRELREETGLVPVRFWALPSVNHFYEWQRDTVALVPAFAAEVDADPELDREHDAFAWLPAEAAAARLAWPEQARLLRLAEALLRAGGVPPELEIPLRGGKG
jgi:dihydroneopterin triphosphate diphosphatase